MDNATTEGGPESADDDPGGQRPEACSESGDDVPDSFFDLTIFDHARARTAAALALAPTTGSTPEAARLWHWSEAAPLLLGMPRCERNRLAEFMGPRLTSAVRVRPAEIWPRERFMQEAALEEKPTNGAQLVVCGVDGIVDEHSWQARYGQNGTSRQVVNLDHHRGATAETPSSAVQFLRYLLDTFCRKLELGDLRPLDVRLFCNDPDQDVSAVVALARELPRILALPERELHEVAEYLAIQDLLDRYAAMVPVNPESAHLRWNSHINQPYTEARRASAFNLPSTPNEQDIERASGVMTSVIDGVAGRLGAFVAGERQARHVSTSINFLHESDGWCLIDESDPLNGEWAGVGALHRGKQLLVKARPAGDRFIYSFNLVAPQFLPEGVEPLAIDLPAFLRRLQVMDGEARYGGSQRCGGCRAGSLLHPDRMITYVGRCLGGQDLNR